MLYCSVLRCAASYRQGWTVVELETLPPGVALPLREALQKCRHHPPSGESSLRRVRPCRVLMRRRLHVWVGSRPRAVLVLGLAAAWRGGRHRAAERVVAFAWVGAVSRAGLMIAMKMILGGELMLMDCVLGGGGGEAGVRLSCWIAQVCDI